MDEPTVTWPRWANGEQRAVSRRLPAVMAAVAVADDPYGSIRTIAEHAIAAAPRDSTARLARRVERIARQAAEDYAAEKGER